MERAAQTRFTVPKFISFVAPGRPTFCKTRLFWPMRVPKSREFAPALESSKTLADGMELRSPPTATSCSLRLQIVKDQRTFLPVCGGNRLNARKLRLDAIARGSTYPTRWPISTKDAVLCRSHLAARIWDEVQVLRVR